MAEVDVQPCICLPPTTWRVIHNWFAFSSAVDVRLKSLAILKDGPEKSGVAGLRDLRFYNVLEHEHIGDGGGGWGGRKGEEGSEGEERRGREREREGQGGKDGEAWMGQKDPVSAADGCGAAACNGG